MIQSTQHKSSLISVEGNYELPKKYSEEFRRKLVLSYNDGQSVASLAEKYNISKSVLYNWIHEFSRVQYKDGEEITLKRLYLLEKRITRLTKEIEIWRRSECAITSPLSEKLKAIDLLKDEYGVHATCETLGVRRSTFYHYSLRSPEKTMVEIEDERLKPAILEIFDASKQRFGAKKIRVKLIELGFTVSTKRIVRLMKEMELSCRVPKPSRYDNNRYYGRFRKNKLKRQFNQTAPNLVWVSDITYVKVSRVNHYICVIIDLFSRKVLATSISDQMDVELIISTFKKAYASRTCTDALMFHSDQGAQYTSQKFRNLLKKLGVNQSFSSPGSPYDNAVAEAFFASLKKEELHRCVYETVGELHISVNEYVHFFNTARPHQRLEFKTPDQVEKEYFQK